MIGSPAKSLRVAAPRGEGRDHLAIARAGARDPIMTLPPQEASFFGHVTFGSGGLEPGRYVARLMKDDGYAELIPNTARPLGGPAPDLSSRCIVAAIGADLAKASIFALSSRREGFPLILVEAMSKGLAVVNFACPTGPEQVIEDHANGILVPPLDPSAFAAALRELIEDEPLRRRLGWEALLDDLLGR